MAVSATLPITFDDHATTGYPSLTWVEFCADAIPALKKTFQAVEKTTTCSELDKDLKGSAKFDAATFNFDPGDSSAAATILKNHFDGPNKNNELAFKVIFSKRAGETTPEEKCTTALVGGYADSNGGDKNAVDLKEVSLWIQREIVTVDAA
jgi:hypothetical protein